MKKKNAPIQFIRIDPAAGDHEPWFLNVSAIKMWSDHSTEIFEEFSPNPLDVITIIEFDGTKHNAIDLGGLRKSLLKMCINNHKGPM